MKKRLPQLWDQRVSGEELRDEAIKLVKENAASEFMPVALSAITSVAQRRSRFTADYVWNEIGTKASTHDNRAWRAAMTEARRRLVIRPTDQWEKSGRPQCHARPMRVWESLIYSA